MKSPQVRLEPFDNSSNGRSFKDVIQRNGVIRKRRRPSSIQRAHQLSRRQPLPHIDIIQQGEPLPVDGSFDRQKIIPVLCVVDGIFGIDTVCLEPDGSVLAGRVG